MYQSIWNWIQHYYKPTKKIWQKKRTKISQFIIIDETVIRVGRQREEEVVVWLWMDGLQLNLKVNQFWICIHAYFSRRSILIAERLLQELIKKYGKNPVSTDDGGGGGTWYGIRKHVDF